MKKTFYSISILLIILISSCEKFLDNDPPVQDIVSQKVFNNEESANAAVVGLYSRMTARNNDAMNGFLSIFTGLAGDEIWNTSTNASYDAFKNNAILDNNTVINSNLWTPLYNYIYHANTIIEHLNKSNAITAETKNRLLGEMYFIRAILNFYLVNLFGDIPLILTADYELNRYAQKSNQEEVYKQITNDLLIAKDLLLEPYTNTERIRPNKHAAKALLARIYLYTKKYELAITEATDIIQSGTYQLEINLSNTFLPTSKEAILQLYPTNTAYNTAEGFAFIPTNATARPALSFYRRVTNGFEPGDMRKVSWIDTRILSGISYSYPSKYKVRANTIKSEYNTVIRLAEMYLIRAESNLNLGNTKDAIRDLNIIRSRAGISALDENIPKDDCFTTMMNERQNEFFAEWGHRWLDLKRWNMIDQEIPKTKTGWESSDSLFPIPYDEFVYNPYL
ncbi:membrane protein [Sphingobacterium faecium NBRC 15299]|uniref:RagB/SusD family nutrient uptake outer membrane protein n=1 Tax=Sphingobacterium faecium TaxID=34087 RepID=UPI000D37F720|nr:RagB/SusD family nutrient uptake outer membrane protein [Sphingobacterium faecium]PTX09455.1 RagB/SusD domain-containing protein [Sphingobacterium faecium]GEM63919.1 membrane protein [Sphingobacterium faecium NBRC 15299]